MKTEIKYVYNPFYNEILHLLCSIIFFLRWRIKKLSTGVAWGYGGTVLISSWKCNLSIYLDIQVYYLDIQAITTLYAFYWFFLFIHFSILQSLSWKVTFSGIQKPAPPTVLNLKASSGFIVKKKQVRITNYLGLPKNWQVNFFFKVAYFAPKNTLISKKTIKMYYSFLKDNSEYVYMY